MTYNVVLTQEGFMRSGSVLPIEQFVSQHYGHPSVQKVVEGWRVEPQIIIDKLIEHFKEMGLFLVPADHEPVVMADIIHQLKHSQDIIRIIQKSKAEESRKARGRITD